MPRDGVQQANEHWRQRVHPEDAYARRECRRWPRSNVQPVERFGMQMGKVLDCHAVAPQSAPELGLPLFAGSGFVRDGVRVLPGEQHVGPIEAVLLESCGEHARETESLAGVLVLIRADERAQRFETGLLRESALEQVEDAPDERVANKGVVDPRCRDGGRSGRPGAVVRERLRNGLKERRREWEFETRGTAVPARELVTDPSFGAATLDDDRLGRERVERCAPQVEREPFDQR